MWKIYQTYGKNGTYVGILSKIWKICGIFIKNARDSTWYLSLIGLNQVEHHIFRQTPIIILQSSNSNCFTFQLLSLLWFWHLALFWSYPNCFYWPFRLSSVMDANFQELVKANGISNDNNTWIIEMLTTYCLRSSSRPLLTF